MWGLVASRFGLTASLTTAAVLLIGTAVSMVVLPLRPNPGSDTRCRRMIASTDSQQFHLRQALRQCVDLPASASRVSASPATACHRAHRNRVLVVNGKERIQPASRSRVPSRSGTDGGPRAQNQRLCQRLKVDVSLSCASAPPCAWRSV